MKRQYQFWKSPKLNWNTELNDWWFYGVAILVTLIFFICLS